MTDSSDLNALLKQGIELARTGQQDRARAIFEQVILADEYNETAWMWMAAVAPSKNQRREALEIVLEINPENERARQALNRLGGPRARQLAEQSQLLADRIGGEAMDERDLQRVAARPAEPEPEPEAEPEPDATTQEAQRQAEIARQLIEAARAAEAREATSGGPREEVELDIAAIQRARALESTTDWLRFIAPLFIVALVIAGGILLAVTALSQTPTVVPTATVPLETALAMLATPTPTATATPSPDPGVVVTAVQGEATALPATWTPSHTPTATLTFTPSPTPLPPENYTLLFSRRSESGDYHLYSARGDGDQLRLLSEGENDRDPAPALAGGRVVFASTSFEGDRELFMGPLLRPSSEFVDETGDPIPPPVERLTSLGATRLGSPSWSSDGFRIVFSSDHDGDEEIYIINQDGSGLTKLTSNVRASDRDPAWSPDGQFIVFASDRDGEGLYELYRMLPNGTEVIRLTDAGGSSFRPAWSPDSQFIVFVSDRDRDADLYIMRADGTDERLLTRNDDAEDRNPAWSPDGRWIAFSSNRDSLNFRVFLHDPFGETVLPVTTGDSDDLDVAWVR